MEGLRNPQNALHGVEDRVSVEGHVLSSPEALGGVEPWNRLVVEAPDQFEVLLRRLGDAFRISALQDLGESENLVAGNLRGQRGVELLQLDPRLAEFVLEFGNAGVTVYEFSLMGLLRSSDSRFNGVLLREPGGCRLGLGVASGAGSPVGSPTGVAFSDMCFRLLGIVELSPPGARGIATLRERSLTWLLHRWLGGVGERSAPPC